MENETKKWYVTSEGAELLAFGDLKLLEIPAKNKVVGIIDDHEEGCSIYLPSTISDAQLNYLEAFTAKNINLTADSNLVPIMKLYKEVIENGVIDYRFFCDTLADDFSAINDAIACTYIQEHQGVKR